MTQFKLKLGNTSGPVTHFFHGFMGSHSDWLSIIDPLLEKYLCVLWDLPGHGQSSLPSAPNQLFKHFFQDAPQADFYVGYSMGGRIASWLAMQEGVELKGLFLESAHLGLESTQEKELRRASDSKLLENIQTSDDLLSFLNNWYANPLWGNLNQAPDYAQFIESKKMNQLEGWKAALKYYGLGEQPGTRNFWQHSVIPICYLSGELDLKYMEIARSLPKRADFNRHEIVNAGHNTKFTEPDQFTEKLLEFLKKYSP